MAPSRHSSRISGGEVVVAHAVADLQANTDTNDQQAKDRRQHQAPELT